jgi:hypothetical protein
MYAGQDQGGLMARSVGITISAIIVFIGSGFTLLFGAIGVLGLLVLQHSGQTLNLPANFRYFVVAEAVFILGFGGWGIATGVGLIGTKQWARICMLVFAVMLLLFSLPTALFMAFIPLPNTSSPDLPSNFGSILRVGFVVFYGMFAALGGFWLYFFNRRNVKEQFRGKQPAAEAATGLSAETSGVGSRSRPVSITIIGWFLLVGSALAPLSLLFSHSMFRGIQMPMCFLGFFLFGRSAMLVLAIWMALQLVAAVGLLKLRNWGRLATIGLQCLGIVNAVILVAVPANRIRFQQLMDSLTASMNAQLPQPVPFVVPVWIEIAISLPFFLLILWFLITRKRAFVSSTQEPATP